jgi:hypothetical protein
MRDIHRMLSCRFDLAIIRTEVVDSIFLHVRPTFSEFSISPEAFATLDLFERAMHSHQKDVEWPQHAPEVRSPFRELDDVVNDEVGASGGERSDAPMKPIEESRPNVTPPLKRPLGVSPFG